MFFSSFQEFFSFSSPFSALLTSEQIVGAKISHSFFSEKTLQKEKIVERNLKRKLQWNVWETQTRLEKGPTVATDTCSEFRNIFRRYVIVIWKESPSSKWRALHKGKLNFTAWVLFHCLGINLTFENQLYYKASERAPASRNQAASPLSGFGWLRRKLFTLQLNDWTSNIEAVCKEVRR